MSLLSDLMGLGIPAQQAEALAISIENFVAGFPINRTQVVDQDSLIFDEGSNSWLSETFEQIQTVTDGGEF